MGNPTSCVYHHIKIACSKKQQQNKHQQCLAEAWPQITHAERIGRMLHPGA